MLDALTVIALGGNAISPPHGDLSLMRERSAIANAAAELAGIARGSTRLLVVHGNGPQVGRLLAAPGIGNPDALDLHVAQTQGELGYLLSEALDQHLGAGACVAVVTRALVAADDPAFALPTKPVGAVLAAPPAGVASARTPDGRGWRRVVASPRPTAVVEQSAIAALLARFHVIAGGGGGVALRGSANDHQPCPAVIDKDWIAALLAIALDAQRLVFVTDVSHAYDGYGGHTAIPITRMTVAQARQHLAAGTFAPGSMAPKVESAIEYVTATDRYAVITTLGAVQGALNGTMGTAIVVR